MSDLWWQIPVLVSLPFLIIGGGYLLFRFAAWVLEVPPPIQRYREVNGREERG